MLTHGPRQAHVWLIFDVGRTMKAVELTFAVVLVALSGCVNRTSMDDQAHIALNVGERLSEERQMVLRQLLHEAFDWDSVTEPQMQSFYEVLELLHRTDLGDERVVSIAFVSDQEVVVALHHRNQPVVVHPSRSLRVQRRAGFWVIAPPDHYRPV